MPEDQRQAQTLSLLAQGEIEIKGRLPWSSNGTFLVGLCRGEAVADAVYKPLRGERPLWDFPRGLYRREIAAYRLSEALGWGIVPETVLRRQAPLGEGSLQLFVDADFSQHYFTLVDHQEHHDQLRRIAVFDLLANNADRKSGHCLLGRSGHIWAIDHGVCFHTEPKLRTVIWDFVGERLDEGLRGDVSRVAADPPALDDLLSPAEVAALARRASIVAGLPRFPDPGTERPYPWPMV
ncbi:MAG: SCO1664 family protein [Actinobacteria bacterium]|nr:SCO1664 family protein [Actinomycetota bacterium]